MELRDVVRRIIQGHWVLLIAFIAVGAVAGFALHANEGHNYTASTRLVLDAPDPKVTTEATAISDTARAIATSPTHLAGAIAASGAERDQAEVVRNIAVQPLGTSGVIQLSVTDRDPQVAAALSVALANDVVKTRRTAAIAAKQDQITKLDQQIAALNTSIGAIDQRLNELDSQLAGVSLPGDAVSSQIATARATVINNRITEANAQRSTLTTERTALQLQRQTLANAEANLSSPAVIDPAVVPSRPDASRRWVDAALGGLAGLILGLMIAALFETFLPTVPSPEALARLLGAASLGRVTPSGKPTPGLAPNVRHAASKARVDTVQLVGAHPHTDLAPLAEWLETWINAGSPPGQRRLAVRTLDDALEGAQLNGNGRPRRNGLVVVSPASIKRADLEPLHDVVAEAGQPLLGVVGYTERRAGSGRLPVLHRPSRPEQAVIRAANVRAHEEVR